MCPNCETLKRRIAYLEGRIGVDGELDKAAKLVAAFGLSITEARVVMRLFAGASVVSSWGMIDDLGISSLNSLSVHVVRIRHKLGDHDVIQTIERVGYRLTDAGRERVEALLNPQTEIAA
jgi:hypothetical protein